MVRRLPPPSSDERVCCELDNDLLAVIVVIELIGVEIKFDNDDGSVHRTVVAMATKTMTMSKCISSTPAQFEGE